MGSYLLGLQCRFYNFCHPSYGFALRFDWLEVFTEKAKRLVQIEISSDKQYHIKIVPKRRSRGVYMIFSELKKALSPVQGNIVLT